VKRKTVYFTAPKQVELREESLPALGPDDVLVETVCSSISAGSEMLVYRGQFPKLVDAHDTFSSNINYPSPYGYACVGIIRETGKRVNKDLRDKLVFGFQPHTSSFICHPSTLIFAPASLSAETCSFLPNMETAVNLVQDAAPIIGERVLVLGQGVVGLLTTSLLYEFPIEVLVTTDNFELRRKSSLDIGVNETFGLDQIHQSAYAKDRFDLVLELTGNPSALNDAIPLTKFNGRIVIGSWYGEKHAEINLGGSFHRSRIKLISSQVSTISPELSGRWDKLRRFEVAWKALGMVKPEKWITHRFHIEDAGKAYELIDKNPQETIQVLFDYKP
jgi:2-desacetyl-2-hydroxyethyl bacteriochlorophyllide A dehydrogenase